MFCKSLRVNGLRYSAVSSLQISQQTRHTFVDYVYFGAVWCMGLCHEVVRRTRNAWFGVRDREK